MARMIPAVLASDTASPGERELFKRLREDPGTEGWIVLHSFNLPRHVAQVRGEADFVILAPGLGMLCLEVKAHRRVARDTEGRWRLGADPPTSRSPFKQADDNMHSLLRVLKERRQVEAEAVIAWSAVAFTHAEFRVPAVEWNEWDVVDSRDLRRHPVADLVTRILQEARRCLPHKALDGVPTKKECDVIAAALRPKFEALQPAGQRRADAEAELLAFTEEQYTALEGMARNPRVVFEGPAGTGKTLLAIEQVRRAASDGQTKVGLLCFNRLLGKWLAAETEGLPGVESATLHQLMLASAGTSPPPAPDAGYFQRELPELAISALLDSAEPPRFDVLIVDEAQDILRDEYLDFLDLSLDGGLSSGRWTMFGDFARQALFDAADVSLDAFLSRRRNPPVFSLHTNCRNTPRVAHWVSMLSALNPPYSKILRPDRGPAPRMRYYAGVEDQSAQVADLLADLFKSGLEGRDIVLLSPAKDEAATRLAAPWKDRVRRYEAADNGNYIRHTRIQAFKGLEAPVIIITDISEVQGERARSLFYTASTRATEQLHVFADAVLRDELLDLMDRFHGGDPVA